jgi:TolB-like protein/cytochrome c-type biogenesis protein CcmH/NrfG
MGDGMLAQFESAADSAHCAIEIQKQASIDLDAKIRIGIHLGDITLENHDVFGDGVNIASRLQSIADPGGIYISESVFNAIRSRKDIQSQYLGEVKLKNVNYPFKTYYLKGNGLPIPSKNRIDELTGLQKPEAIVVLPFDNFTGNSELEYFVAGMHASLIGSIGKVSGLRVISKTTSNAFKDTRKSIPEIAAELGVNKIVEASVLSLEEKISLQVKLINANPEEKQLWIRDYIEEKGQILNLYNTVTKEISQKINIKLTEEEERFLAKARTVDREVYDAYLKSYQYWEGFTDEALNKAKEYLIGAIKLDPEWAPLYTGLANIWMGLAQQSFEEPSVAYPKVYELLDTALELDPDHADTHYLLAMTAWLNQWDWPKAEKEFLKTLARNPNHALSRMWYAHLLCILQRPDEGIAQAELALDLDPLNPLIKLLFAATLSHAGKLDEARVSLENLLVEDPANFIANQMLNLVAFNIGDYDRVITTEKNQLQVHLGEQFDENTYQEIEGIFTKKGFSAAYDKILALWNQLAKNKFMLPCDLAIAYIKAGQLEKAINLIEKGYESKDPTMPYIGVMLKSLYDHPRFKTIIEKMNLPLP